MLNLTKTAIRDGRIWRRTSKTGQEVSTRPSGFRASARRRARTMPLRCRYHQRHAVDVSGFNSTFIKAIGKLRTKGRLATG